MARKKKPAPPEEPPAAEVPRRRSGNRGAKERPAEAAPLAAAEAPKDTSSVAEPGGNKKGRSKKGARKKEAAAAPAPPSLEPAAAAPVPSDDTGDAALEAQFSTDGNAAPLVAGPDDSNPEGAPVESAIDAATLLRTLEALLFAAEEPLPARELGRATGTDAATVRKVLPLLKKRYESEARAWELVEVAGGYRLVTRAEFFPAIQKLKTQTLSRKLTQAALETLALIAYRQPLSRAEIESVRGVGAGPVLRQLLERKLIRIAGRGTGLGQPLLYGTTDVFLEHFGLKSVQDLPKPGEFKNA